MVTQSTSKIWPRAIVLIDMNAFFGAPGQAWYFQQVRFLPQKELTHSLRIKS
jgi:hypothetical protein